MDPPVAAGVENKTQKTKNAKSYECGLCDTEVVYKIAQELLPGLAESCVDSTTGGIFKSAGSVAFDMRKEMTDYLTQRSETYVAEFILSENASMLETSDHPFDIITKLIDDFSSTKTNMFSRVSEWVLTDRREDRIDDFVQEMEINGFWLLARREYVASMLLKNVDYKNAYHCNTVCNSEEEFIKHQSECKFRPLDCTNEGCSTRYCAAQKENHEAVCPFMILPCEQKCLELVMRREMDRHCVTICPMKRVKCAFYTVGCKSSIPQCNVQQHNADDLSLHLLYVIKTAHKEANDEDLIQRVEQIYTLSNTEKLIKARDARALTYLIKDAEVKLGPLDLKTKVNAESPTKAEFSKVKGAVDSPKKKEENQGSESATSSTEKPVITEDDPVKQAHQEMPKSAESAVKVEEKKDNDESSAESAVKVEEKKDNDESSAESAVKVEEKKDNDELSADSAVKIEEKKDNDESSGESAVKVEEKKDEDESSAESPVKVEENIDNDESSSSPVKEEHEHSESPLKKEVLEDLQDVDSKKVAAKEQSTEVKDELSNTVTEKRSSSDEEDTKSSKKETVEESSRNDEDEPTKSTEKETVKE